MNWDAIGAVGEIVGALAVVLSLFYVGRQVRESSKAVKGQTYQSLVEFSGQILSNVVNDPSYGEISRRVFANQELDENQQHRYQSQFSMFLRMLESAHHQYSLGLISEAQLHSLAATLNNHLASNAGSRAWDYARSNRPKQFSMFIDEYRPASDDT